MKKDTENKKEVTIESIAILAKLSDGTVKQIMVTNEEQGIWLSALHNFYNPVKVIDKTLDAIEF